MKKILILASLAVCLSITLYAVSENDYPWKSAHDNGVETFKQWQLLHGKFYLSPEEQTYRLRIFLERLDFIRSHNSQQGITYTQGLNFFSDMTYEEFITKFTGDLSHDEFKQLGNSDVQSPRQTPLEDGIDWTAKGAVNPVQNQGKCGSCWSFAATASFETAYFKKFHTLMKFSEQAGVDCDIHSDGCNGGSAIGAMNFQKE